MPQESVLSMAHSGSMGNIHGYDFESSDVLHRNNFATAQSFPCISNDGNNFMPTFNINLNTSPMFDGNTFAYTQPVSTIFDFSLDLDADVMFDGCNLIDMPLAWEDHSYFSHQE